MKRVFQCALGLFFAATVYGQVTIKESIPHTATIEVNAAAVGQQPIPRTIFGTFLEPIGNSTYNGLWAELLQNPSLEAGLWSPARIAEMLHDNPELRQASNLALPLPWEPLDASQGNRYEVHFGEAANSWQSLRVFGIPGQPTGIKQQVYLPIHRTRDYAGSFYAKHLSGDKSITISLRVRNQKEVLASQQLQVADAAWTKYTFTLQVADGKLHRLDPADFVAQLAGDERVELDQFSLMPADAKGGLDPDAVALAKQMNTPLVRFGGNFTSSYHWTDGVGPRDKRNNAINNSWGIPEYNSFGTDEFLEFCRQIGAQPQVALNLGSGTPEEAAAWVRYVDEHWSTHSGLLWELGNELWGNWNLGYPTREQLAGRTAVFSKAVRAVDPSARLIATGADPEVFNSWNAIQLTSPPGTFDYLSTHFVVGTSEVLLKNPTPEFVTEAAFALPVELGNRLRQAQSQIDSTAGYSGKVHLAFTEWLFIGRHTEAPSFTNTGGAIVTGGFLNMMLRNSQIVPISDMTGIMEFAGIWKKRSQVFGTPSYYVFKLYANADIEKPVAVTVNAGSYSVAQGVKRLPEIASVPYLDVVAALSRDGKTLTLFCVNRSLDKDISTNIRLHDFTAAHAVAAHTLSAPNLADANDEVAPDRVKPVDSVEVVQPDGWTHTFRHASVTVISLDRK
ncbi:MAG: alpha-L-arabinofuranosidase C-terminal domain-containing protein [Terracidiphilus sp.]